MYAKGAGDPRAREVGPDHITSPYVSPARIGVYLAAMQFAMGEKDFQGSAFLVAVKVQYLD